MNLYADSEKLKELKSKANKLPLLPGVYIMKNKQCEIIYIGKAKALKNRVTQYFGSGNQHTEKVKRMVSNVDNFEHIICDSEFEALILENSLIKQHQPKYNILLKDDKGYHYIKVTDEKWPRIEAVNTKDRIGSYIGPYNSGYIVKETVDEVRKIFKLPDCKRNFDTPSKPCLNYHIGLCEAPCKGKISSEEYGEIISSAVDFIKHGGTEKGKLDILTEKMHQAAEQLDFELAAKLRDRINAINKINERQKVYMIPYSSQDVIASAFIGEKACVEIFIFRNNRLTDKQHYFVDGVSSKASLYSEFISRYYSSKSDIPPRIVIDSDFDDLSLSEKWLTEKSKRKTEFIIPKQGDQKKLLDMCLNNAADNLSYKTKLSGKETAVLNELASVLGLSTPPMYIEAYDISNTAGSENVAGMIVFKNGKPYKGAYNRFKIKGFSGQDDYRSMAEVLDRRFAEYEKGEDEGFKTLPDLILLDGGKGQISAVLPIMQKYNLNIPLFGMVKDSKHRTRAVATSGGDILIKANRSVYTLVTSIQEEVHRFAIGYHSKRRSIALLSSELLKIKGIGKNRAQSLIKHFSTLDKIKKASVNELSKVNGISSDTAQAIYDFFNS